MQQNIIRKARNIIKQCHDTAKGKNTQLIINIAMIVLSALSQTYIMKVFMEPCNLLAGGFTGIALLANKILALCNVDFSVSIGIVMLNLPAIIICYTCLSKRFAWLSCLHFVFVSFFMAVLHFDPLFEDKTLNVVFGGVLWGLAISLSLKAGGSTGGTDFIAQYVSNKIHKGIWQYVFCFNCFILIIFGYIFGWVYAGYSIVFQYLSTKTISTLYQRYAQITVEITTKKPDEISKVFFETCRHGMSVVKGYGGYSHQQIYICKSVISTYEVQAVIRAVREIDKRTIINTYRTESFYGGFYRKPMS